MSENAWKTALYRKCAACLSVFNEKECTFFPSAQLKTVRECYYCYNCVNVVLHPCTLCRKLQSMTDLREKYLPLSKKVNEYCKTCYPLAEEKFSKCGHTAKESLYCHECAELRRSCGCLEDNCLCSLQNE